MFNTVAIVSAPTLPSPGLTFLGLQRSFFGAPSGSASGQAAGRAFSGLVPRPTLRSLTFGGSLLLSGRSLDPCFLQLLRRVFAVTFYLCELSLTPRLPPKSWKITLKECASFGSLVHTWLAVVGCWCQYAFLNTLLH